MAKKPPKRKGGASRKRGSESEPAEGSANRKPSAATRPRRRWINRRHPIVRFVAPLLIILGVFEIALATNFAKEKVVPPYLHFWAKISGSTLEMFGENMTVSGTNISSPRYSVNIKRGCDAFQPSILLVAAVLASPVLAWTKLPGLVFGLLVLMVMNLVRVVSLFYIGIHFSAETFDIMHHDVWQLTFILLAILAWALWALWAADKTASRQHAKS